MVAIRATMPARERRTGRDVLRARGMCGLLYAAPVSLRAQISLVKTSGSEKGCRKGNCGGRRSFLQVELRQFERERFAFRTNAYISDVQSWGIRIVTAGDGAAGVGFGV